MRGGCTTYFRVSRLLQVEQEKQCTHQALLRADTTVKGRRRLSDPTGQPQGPPGTGGAGRARLQGPQAQSAQGTGAGAGSGHRDGASPSPSITWLQV